jgi:uncharacterized protein (TIGR02266 family)
MAEPNDKELRGPVNLRIKFRSASLQQFIERYGVDVSRGGIFIRTREPLPVGTRLKLDFQLVDAAPLFQGDGTVVWIREYDPGKTGVTPGMGVRFDRLTPESQPTLDKILDEKMRLQQTGVAPGGAATAGAGLAVRRPSGVITALDARAPKSPPPPAAVEVKMDAPTVGAAPVTTMPASQSRSGPVASSGGGVFSRPRTTSGLSSLRSAPVPSALFEAPTAADIDKALLALEEKGPTPAMPVPPPPPPVSVAPATHVGDDEPTKVFDVAAQEFAVHEAVTGQRSVLRDSAVPVATDGTGDDLTAKREVEQSEPVPAVGQSAPGKDAPMSMKGSLDAPLAAHLDGTAPVAAPAASSGRRDTPASAAAAAAAGVPKRIAVDQPGRAIESGRFRSDAKYRRSSRNSGKIVIAVLLAGAAATGVVFGKREYDKRKAAAIATAPAPAEIAAPVPPPAPPPAAENTGAAPSPPAAEAKPETPTVAAPANTPETVTAPPQPETGAKADKAPGEKPAGDRPAKSGRKKSAAPVETAAASAPNKTEKPAATPPEGGKGGKGDKAPAETAAAGSAGAEAPKTAEAAPAEKPVLKITSSPTGAEVVIDGSSVGTTPYSSKDVDPTAAHAITVRKDGFEAHERMISGSDWTKSRSGTQSLKMNIRLKRTGPSEAAPPKDEGKASDVEVLTPSEP